MTTSLFFALLLGVGALYIAWPMLNRNAEYSVPRSRARAHYAALQTQADELELDFRTGKLEADEYSRLRRDLTAEGFICAARLQPMMPLRALSRTQMELEAEAEILIARARRARSAR